MLRFLQFFSQISFFFLFQDPILHSNDISLGLGMTFPQTFHFLDDLDSNQIVLHVFYCVLLNRDVSDVFLMIRLQVMCFGEEDNRGQVPFKGTSYPVYTLSIWLILLMSILITWWSCTYLWLGNICPDTKFETFKFKSFLALPPPPKTHMGCLIKITTSNPWNWWICYFTWLEGILQTLLNAGFWNGEIILDDLDVSCTIMSRLFVLLSC